MMVPAHRGRSISEAAFRRMWADTAITMEEIGRALDISASAVRLRAISRGLPRRGHPRVRGITGPEFGPMYLAGVSRSALARHYGVCGHVVTKTARRLGLSRPYTSRWHALSIEDYRATLQVRAMAEAAARTRAALAEAALRDQAFLRAAA